MMDRVFENFIAAVVLVLIATMVVIPFTRLTTALMDNHANAVAERSFAKWAGHSK